MSGAWNEWLEHPEATNLWITSPHPVRVKLADGTIVTPPPVAASDVELINAIQALRQRSGESS